MILKPGTKEYFVWSRIITRIFRITRPSISTITIISNITCFTKSSTWRRTRARTRTIYILTIMMCFFFVVWLDHVFEPHDLFLFSLFWSDYYSLFQNLQLLLACFNKCFKKFGFINSLPYPYTRISLLQLSFLHLEILTQEIKIIKRQW